MRIGEIQRNTKETQISVKVCFLSDENTKASIIDTGIGFLDHMLTLFAFHGKLKIELKCKGDLYVDTHHSVEDIGICLGKAFAEALGSKKGIARYGNSIVPMDEALARSVIDISGRPYLVFNVDLKKEKLGQIDSEDFKEFFRAFVMNAGVTAHFEVLYGENDHHKIEAIFKSFGRSMAEAVKVVSQDTPSTKGVL